MSNEVMTTTGLREMKERGVKIAALTAWDYFSGTIAEAAGADLVLVGDSLAMSVQGDTDTLAVTLDEMIYHTRLAARACRRSLVVTDMPFMSYQASPEQALINCGRVLKETKARGVKLEGGEVMAETTSRVTGAGIPVVGHIGLTPQAVHKIGGFKAQGKTLAAARRLVADAKALQDAGACALILECVPTELAAAVTGELAIPTIGIGAGAGCDGQIQVTADLLGLGSRVPKHAGKYVDFTVLGREALGNYISDVRSGAFPEEKHALRADADLRAAIESEEL